MGRGRPVIDTLHHTVSGLKGNKKRSAKNGQKIEREVDGGT